MAVDSQSGLYTASIPAAFIDPHWDLMYFVEIVDREGNGRMYPDLAVETPRTTGDTQSEASEVFKHLRNKRTAAVEYLNVGGVAASEPA